LYSRLDFCALAEFTNWCTLFLLKTEIALSGHLARTEDRRVAYRVLVGSLERKRSLGTPRRRWEDNIKIDLQEVGWEGLDWIDQAQYRDRWWALLNAVMYLWVP
jgi:hypothetical protein